MRSGSSLAEPSGHLLGREAFGPDLELVSDAGNLVNLERDAKAFEMGLERPCVLGTVVPHLNECEILGLVYELRENRELGGQGVAGPSTREVVLVEP